MARERAAQTVNLRIASVALLVAMSYACLDTDSATCVDHEVGSCTCLTGRTGTWACQSDHRRGYCECGNSSNLSCGDGVCNGTDPTHCPDDCRNSCGDGRCARGETPTSCPSDCFACRACDADGACPQGMRCGRRPCDGARGCVPIGASARCDFVGDVPLPRSCQWEPCVAGRGDCGPNADCALFRGGEASVCVGRCETSDDCMPSADSVATAICARSVGRCLLDCSKGELCPPWMTCLDASMGGDFTCR